MNSYDIRRQKQREETENRIIEVAINLFGKKGYAKTSIKDIAEEAGVAVGLVGKYFPTKEILLSEAYKHATYISYSTSADDMDATESMRILIRHTVDVFRNKPEYFLFFKTMMNASDLPREYTEARREFFCNSTIYPHIISEQKKGTLLGDDPHSSFIIFMKMVYTIVEMYEQMPHENENYVFKRTIEVVMNTIDEC